MKKRILVVDDELSIRMLLDNFLSDDYTVFTKDNGYEAMSWFKEGNTADLILVDIDMPMINGYELTESIRKQTGMQAVPIIMLSCKQKSEDRIKSFTAGADDYLQKPFNPEELLVRIQSVFRRSQAA
ncbi:MAG: response regulator transcription factor [Bacteroidia bacterium]|jgi:DNA-binding response OmpR family regulator|nr:response regulator transcription factor [Bacteroidota bacterium]MBP6512874.1 response regulator transcription factor [Bacteroidia bacterium]MBP7244046.1 response regulator transcription factor [Bacteroidia bacterium]